MKSKKKANEMTADETMKKIFNAKGLKVIKASVEKIKKKEGK